MQKNVSVTNVSCARTRLGNDVSELTFCCNFPPQLPQLRKRDASGNDQKLNMHLFLIGCKLNVSATNVSCASALLGNNVSELTFCGHFPR